MGFAGFYGTVNNNIKRVTSDLGAPARDQWGLEMYYSFEVTPWFHVTPDAQLIRSARRDDSTAAIFGVRAVVDF